MGAVYAVPPKQKIFASKDSFKEVRDHFRSDPRAKKMNL
jgi:hypothetical protein